MSMGEPINLRRWTPETEERWQDGAWVPSDVIGEYLALGEGDYDEITTELAMATFPDAFADLTKSIGAYEVSKAEDMKRYTLGAMYIPDRLDAHSEWTSADELQQAVWTYVRLGDRNIRLQHNREITAGEWVEVMAFPYELTVPVQQADGSTQSHTYPPDTVFLGVIWEPWAWELVQSGKILGYSIGGKAERLYVDMEEVVKDDAAMPTSDGPLASDVHIDTIMNQQKKKKKIPVVEKPDATEVVMEKEKPLDVEALTKTIIDSIKKELPAPVVVEKAPALDIETMMVRLAEIFAANKPIVNVTLPEEKAKNRIIERDEFGNISRIVEED